MGPAGDRVGRLGADLGRIIGVAFPLYLSMIAVSLGSLVNVAVLGRFGTAALAGFAFTGAVYLPAVAAGTAAVRGVMPFISATVEAGPVTARRSRGGTTLDRSTTDRAELGVVLGSGMWLAAVVGVLGAVVVWAVPVVGRATGVPAETIDALGAFPIVMGAAVLVNAFGAMASASLVALGQTRVVLRAGLVGAAGTAVLAPLLVLGPGPVPALGLAGSGLALLGASAASCVVGLRGLRRWAAAPRGAATCSVEFRVRPQAARVSELARVGVPMAGTVLVKFGVLGVLALAASRVGAVPAAAHGIAIALVGLVFTAAVAVGQAGIPLISGRAAAADMPGVRRAARAGLLVAVAVVGGLCLLLVAFRGPIAGLFSDDPAVLSVLVVLLPVLAVAIVCDAVQAVFGFGLTGLKRTVPSFVVFAALYGGLAVLAVPVAQRAGIVGLWLAVLVANALVGVGQGAVFFRHSGRLPAVARR